MYRSIVVGTDGSSRARKAVHHAAKLAQATGASLHLVSAYRSPTITGVAMAPEAAMLATAGGDEDVRRSVESMLEGLAGELRRDGLDVSTYACAAPAADALCDVAAGQSADLIVLGDKGTRGARRLLGSVPSAVTSHADCAVLIVPTGE